MKKVLSIALALVMMFAVCVPAFAANPITNATENTGDALVKTDISGVTGDGTFSVTFDAETTIPWGSDQGVTYKITSQLVSGKCVNVTVAPKAGENSKLTKIGSTYELDYTLDGIGTNYNASAAVVTDETATYNIKVTDWTVAAIDVYEGHVTYTAAIVDA